MQPLIDATRQPHVSLPIFAFQPLVGSISTVPRTLIRHHYGVVGFGKGYLFRKAQQCMMLIGNLTAFQQRNKSRPLDCAFDCLALRKSMKSMHHHSVGEEANFQVHRYRGFLVNRKCPAANMSGLRPFPGCLGNVPTETLPEIPHFLVSVRIAPSLLSSFNSTLLTGLLPSLYFPSPDCPTQPMYLRFSDGRVKGLCREA